MSKSKSQSNCGSSRCSSFLGTLKPGAQVYQDFVFFTFDQFYKDQPVFRFARVRGDDLVGTADGFGSFAPGERYGNGKIYVHEKYVEGVPFVEHGAGI